MTREVTHGADDVLKGVFWDLAQIGEAGEPKYPESILKRLAAKILDGRAHEPLVFRLCHLVRCAELASARGGERYGWLEFFCAPLAGRADWAAGWMCARLPSPDEGDRSGGRPPRPTTWRSASRAARSRSGFLMARCPCSRPSWSFC